MDVEDAVDGLHGFADVTELQVARGAFEEDVEGLADDANRTPENHGGDQNGEDGIDPHETGEENARAPGDDGGGGEGVAEHVEEDAANVNVAGRLPEERGDSSVHQNAGGSDQHHEPGLDGDGRSEAVEGFDGDPGGEDDESDGVDKGGKDASALVTEGLFGCGGAGVEIDGNEGEQDSKEVADVVASFGDKCKGMSAEAEEKRGQDVGRG